MASKMTLIILLALVACATVWAQQNPETFTATATVKTAGGATASVPVTISVKHKMTQTEADRLVAIFKSGGAAALHKALVGVPTTGSVQLGKAKPVASRITLERTTGTGRLLTIITDKPVMFVGGGAPDAKPKAGYEFGVIDLEVDANGNGSGTIAPAAKVKLDDKSAFVVEDYSPELVQLKVSRKTM